MVRKDSERDADRPHYYSQFWLDIAAGRRIIGAPRLDEDENEDEDGEAPVSTAQYHPTVDDDTDTDNYDDNIVHPVAEPIEAPDDFIEPETDELDLATDEPDDADFAETDDADIPDADIPDVDLDTTDEATDTDEDDYDEDEEEDDDLNWGRGRKKAKPSRPVRTPGPKKSNKREPRRNF